MGSTTELRGSGLDRLWKLMKDTPFLLWTTAEEGGPASLAFVNSCGVASWAFVNSRGHTLWVFAGHARRALTAEDPSPSKGVQPISGIRTGRRSDETRLSHVMRVTFILLVNPWLLLYRHCIFPIFYATKAVFVAAKEFVLATLEYLNRRLGEARNYYYKRLKKYVIKRLSAVRAAGRPPYTPPLEESDIATSDKHDVEMLAAVDDALLDDELLRVTMKPAIARLDSEPDDVIGFVFGALQRRLPQLSSAVLSEDGMLSVSRLPGLSSQAWVAITDITVTLMQRHLQQYRHKPVPRDVLDSPWLCNALALLTSRADHPMADDTSKSFSEMCRAYHLQFPWRRCVVNVTIPTQDRWQLFLRVLPREFDDPGHASVAICELYAKERCYPKRGYGRTFLAEWIAAHDLSTNSRHDIQNIVIAWLRQTGEAAGSRLRLAHLVVSTWIPERAWTQQSVDFPKFSLRTVGSRSVDGVSLSERIAANPVLTVTAVRYLTSITFADMVGDGTSLQIISLSRSDFISTDHEVVLSFCAISLDAYTRHADEATAEKSLLFNIPIFLLVQRLLFSYCETQTMGENTVARSHPSEKWASVLPALAAALRAYATASGCRELPGLWTDSQMRKACMLSHWIDGLLPDDPTDSAHQGIALEHAVSWKNVADVLQSIIPGSDYPIHAYNRWFIKTTQRRILAVAAPGRFLSVGIGGDTFPEAALAGDKVSGSRFGHGLA